MRPERASARTAFIAARVALVAIAAALALVAGCGGGTKSGSESPNTAASNAPAPTPTETTVTTPPADAGAAPGAGALSGDLGTRVFAQRCALCHGPDGHGDGPGSKALNPKPRNFHDQAYMSTRTDAQLLETIHNGKGAMPKWGGVLSESEITAVLAHVRELGKRP